MRAKELKLLVLSGILIGAMAAGAAAQQQAPPPPSKFKLSTPAYAEGSMLPTQYTCADPNAASPALQWVNPPAGAVSFAVIFHDTDAAPAKWDNGRHTLDFLEHPSGFDAGHGRHQAGHDAGWNIAGEECSGSKWLPTAMSARGRRPAPLHFRNVCTGPEA